MVHNTLGHRVTQSEVEQWHKHCRMLHRLPSNRPRATISLPLVASFGRSPPSVISPPLWRRLVLGGDAYWTCSPHRRSPPCPRMTRELEARYWIKHLKESENYRSAARRAPMGSLPYRGESWTAGVCLPTADAASSPSPSFRTASESPGGRRQRRCY